MLASLHLYARACVCVSVHTRSPSMHPLRSRWALRLPVCWGRHQVPFLQQHPQSKIRAFLEISPLTPGTGWPVQAPSEPVSQGGGATGRGVNRSRVLFWPWPWSVFRCVLRHVGCWSGAKPPLGGGGATEEEERAVSGSQRSPEFSRKGRRGLDYIPGFATYQLCDLGQVALPL